MVWYLQVREGLEHLFGQRLVAGGVELARADGVFPIALCQAHAQRPLAVLFVGDAHVDILDQLGHHLRRGLAILPQLAADSCSRTRR